MTTSIDERKNREENKKLCRENPDSFMICPRCNGTKMCTSAWSDDTEICDYCNGQGVITWIDRITRNMKNPFTEGG